MNDSTTLEAQVRRYYGTTLQSTADLKTSACCTPGEVPERVRAALANVPDEVIARYYGCGLTIPDAVEGLRVLDLGCGAGRDVYVLAQLVGERGHVTGVDMTPEQLDVARRYAEHHRGAGGYPSSDVRFVEGNVQDLAAAGVASDSVDLIVSNCVVNLAADKAAVLAEAFRVLRDGGELYFSDVYCDRRLPPHLRDDEELYGECLGGALYWNDFLSLAKAAGFRDPRLVTSRRLTLDDPSVARRVEGHRFYAATWRLFKLPALEPACEDYGQAVRYRGGLAEAPEALVLDEHHVFERGRIVTVCGNTWMMLADTRFRRWFDFFGDFSRHYGIFPGCGTSLPFRDDGAASQGGGCC